MRILVLCERVGPLGGVETYLRNVLPQLVAHGDEVLVVARVIAQPGAYGVRELHAAWSDEHDPPSPEAAARVAAIAGDFRPDVAAVHSALDAGVLHAARTLSGRIVYHLHDHRSFCPNGDRLYPQGGSICGVPMSALTCGFHALVHGCAYGPRARTLKLIGLREGIAREVRRSHAVLVYSQYMASLARINGVAPERTHVATLPLPADAYVAAPQPRPSSDNLLFAARVMPSKGGRSLVRALAYIDPSKRPMLRIAGDGPDLKATLREAETSGVAVEPLGRLGGEALHRAYDEATLVAVPSLWGEPFGSVGIEAFARGRPVVAYDAGAIAEWIEGGGRLVARGDERALAGAIEDLLLPDAWSVHSTRAFAAAQRYRLEPHVEVLRALYAGAS